MKTIRPSSRRGFALLLTLIIVSFAAAIAVLFLLSARQERGGTDSYAQGVRVRQLADTAVNIVMGQINTATREGTVSNPISWASQPGMIRTYNTTGYLSHAYKLYSWANMIESTSSTPAFDPDPTVDSVKAYPNNEYPPANWASLPMQYTDLNGPVTVSTAASGTTQVYPIMDPSVANTITGLPTAPSYVQKTQNSAGLNWDFFNEVTLPAAADASQGYAPNTSATSPNPLPMPVQWLYVLQDGTWVFPSQPPTGNSATFDPGIVTTSNPIVGRIAFWTDDETNKVNLNTAGEGAYWDWPKAGTQDEYLLASNPPVRNEFWRVSGHPATTSLSAVFPDIFGFNQPAGGGGNGTINAFARWYYPSNPYGSLSGSSPGGANLNYVAGMEAMLGLVSNTALGAATSGTVSKNGYGLAPRYAFGNSAGATKWGITGSMGGTYPAPFEQTFPPLQTGANSGSFADLSAYYPTTAYSPITLNLNHLYATPDEAFFSPPATLSGALLRSTRNYPLAIPTPSISQQSLSQRFFFLTTDSRAPETTLFNTPRVSMWPITWPYPSSYWVNLGLGGGNSRGGTSGTTIANPPTLSNCPTPGTTNLLPTLENYSYLGNKNIAPQEDVLAYCAMLNPQNTTNMTPYYFQRQSNDSPTYDWSSIPRNQYLANYIRGMVAQNVPGFGGSLETTWSNNDTVLSKGTTADYITLECMDYCRSMINQYTYDPSSTSGALLYSYTGNQNVLWTYDVNGTVVGGRYERMAQSVTPLRITPALLTGTGGATLSPSYFDGLPNSTTEFNNAQQEGYADAYVTPGAFPSLKEVALQFIAVQRLAPGYLGPLSSGVPSPDLTADPFYWANLINVGPPTTKGGNDGLGPDIPSTSVASAALYSGSNQDLTTASTNGQALVPDGNFTATGMSNILEKYDMYPVGAQTTYMKGFLLFDFAGLRDGNIAAPNPTFWLKVTGCNNWGITTDAPNVPTAAFPNVMTGPYHGRLNQGSTDTVFQPMKTAVSANALPATSWNGGARSFYPQTPYNGSPTSTTLALNPDSNWPFCSQPIPCLPTDINFNFSGATIRVAVYAGYGDTDASHTPTTDPTSDPNQFVTSYNLTGFGTMSGPQAMPIAPRWSIRQGTNVPFPQINHPLVYNTATASGVPSKVEPYQANTSSWVATEIVPETQFVSGYNWSGAVPNHSPTPNDGTEFRDMNDSYLTATYAPSYGSSGAHAIDDTGTTGTVGNGTWMMYAGVYDTAAAAGWTGTANYLTANLSNSGAPFDEYIPPPTTAVPPNPNYIPCWSMNMAARITAMQGSGTMVGSEGTPLPTTTVNTSGQTVAVSVTTGPLFTPASFVSGSAAQQSYAQEGFTEITPYDTVMSVMVDPTSASADLTNPNYANVQGDPRLTNMLGEGVTFNESDNVMLTMNSGALSTATVLNAFAPIGQWPSTSSRQWLGMAGPYPTGASYPAPPAAPSYGLLAFPRPTYQSQKHQLGNPGAEQMMTGYHLLPIWGTNLGSTAVSSRWPAQLRNYPYIVAVEGAFGGNGGNGAAENYAGWVGLDTNAYLELNLDWDWSSCPGFAMDGGYVERPDQDYQSFYCAATYENGLGTPYFSRFGNSSITYYNSNSAYLSTTGNFSPNRQVPSPIQFGTLSSSLTNGWQTLAFAPNQASQMDPNSGITTHSGVAVYTTPSTVTIGASNPPYPGTGSPSGSTFSGGVPDHLLLDLFWMPVAEPYPISEEFSTAGKINLNYSIMPFPYIGRKTGLDAVLKSVWIYALPNTVSGSGNAMVDIPQDYKAWYFMSSYSTVKNVSGAPGDPARDDPNGKLTTRYPVNVDNTLKAFDYKFENGDIFRSASQICDMFLYPNDKAVAPGDTTSSNVEGGSGGALVLWDNQNKNIKSWWGTNGMMTSDNGREAPYNAIYSRVTTQSNTYMVHWKVQAVHKLTINGSQPNVWVEGTDRVVSELRGSTLIERYLDPNAGATPANTIPDYANPGQWNWSMTPSSSGPFPITYYYKWRIDNETYFQPQP